MGDLSFGHSFSLVANLNSDTAPHYVPSIITQASTTFQWFTPVPWLGNFCFELAHRFPLLIRKLTRVVTWVEEVCDEQLELNTALDDAELLRKKTALGHFIRSANLDGDKKATERLALCGDTFAIAIGGSHSTSPILIMLFYALAQRPELQMQLREEISSAGIMKLLNNDGYLLREGAAMEGLGKLVLMDACINETMRLHSPIPSGGARQTVDTGVQIGKILIPPQTVVIAPRWSIGRCTTACHAMPAFRYGCLPRTYSFL